MIRLYLACFSEMDCATLYNALHLALASLPTDDSKTRRDIESALDYLTGYSDALRDKRLKKEGAGKCPRT